jgi:hypothetical protein
MKIRLTLLLTLVCAPAPAVFGQRLESWNLSSPAPRYGEFFGHTVALSNAWLAVNSYYGGAHPNHPLLGYGQVHFYERTAAGWSWRQTVDAPDPATAHTGSYGRTMSLDGDTLIVCDAVRAGPSGFSGAVWVYEHDGLQWNLHQRLDRNDAHAGQWADIDGDRIAVSAPYVQVSTPGGLVEQGEVDIYERVAGQWTRVSTLVPEEFFGVGHTVRFGRAVQLSGDLLVAGCQRDTQQQGNGEVRVFQRQSQNQWSEVAVLNRPQYWPPSEFGQSGLALDDEWIMVGDAPRSGWQGNLPPAVFAFRRNPGPTPTWTLQQQISPSVWFYGASGADRFGYSVALSGGRMVVGAPYAPGGHGLRYYGQAWVFELDADGTRWVETQRLSSTEVEAALHPGGFLGWSVDIDGPYIAAGDYYAPVGGPAGFQFGKAYVYEKDLGAPTCVGVPNNLGVPATLSAAGSDRAHVGFLDFTARSMPANSPGMLLAGLSEALILNPGGSVGNMCISGGIIRAALAITDPAGEWRATLPLPPPGATSGVPVVAGSTWHFQTWYRQPNSSNFTGALRVDFE